MSIAAVFCEKKIRKHDIKAFAGIAAFTVLFYFVICLFRSVMSDGNAYLTSSFGGKNCIGYMKVIALLAVVYLAYTFVGFSFKIILQYALGIFSLLMFGCIICVSYPKMKIVAILGIISILGGLIFYLAKNTKVINFLIKEKKSDGKMYTIAVRLLLFAMVFMIEGPIELYAFNQGDFVFRFGPLLAELVVGSIILVILGTILISEYVTGLLFDAVSIVVAGYAILGYVQAMFLNGKMESIDGGFQTWSRVQIITNLMIWLVLAVALFLVEKRLANGRKAVNTVSLLLSLLLIWSSVSVVLTTGVIKSGNRWLTTDDMFTVSGEDDVIVLMLDAYDVQMLSEVLNESPGYLEPLHDFTFYDNMKSEYVYTDGELPYLLTGVKEDIGERTPEQYTRDLYSRGSFVEDLSCKVNDIRILTDCKYAEPVSDGIISNYSTDCKCVLDVDRTVSQMTNCIRYKCLPFAFKTKYHYESYDFTNIIEDTNAYIFGTDYAFDERLLNEGIQKDDSLGSTFRFYHLYGAHAPYYLTEEATLNYSSEPIAQWKGCLKIVYDYLEALNAIGVYDSSTIIIMADHGLNSSNRGMTSKYGFEFSDNTNPIFMIKRRDEHHNELQIDEKETSHDVFCATIMKSYDETDESYGRAVWE